MSPVHATVTEDRVHSSGR